VIAQGLANTAGLATGVVLARLMGREGYGEVGVIVSTFALFTQIGTLSLGATATRYSAQLRIGDPESTGRFLGGILLLSSLASTLLAILIVLFAPQVALTLNRPGLVGALRLSGVVMFLQGIDSIQMGILSGYEAFRTLARVMLVRAFVNLATSVLGAYLYGLLGVVGAMILTNLVTVTLHRRALNAIFAQTGVSIRYALDAAILKPLWEFSFPVFLSGTLTMLSLWGVNALLVNQPEGYSQMGLFNAANQWRALGIFIPAVFTPAVLSIQSSLYASRNRASYHRSVTGNLFVQSAIAALVAFVLAVLAPYLMRLYGSQFHDAANVLVLLALGWFLLTPNSILWIAAISRHDVWWGLLFNAIGIAFLFVFASLFVGSGARGIALAYLYAQLIQLGLQGVHYYVTKGRDTAESAPQL
jgi:O-antigen/teichoic acid export membrane protein